MARHQVLQHRLVSCTSVIPHPFCQRHPKIQFRASPVIAPAQSRPRHRARDAASVIATPADAPCRCTTHLRSQQPDHPPKHPYPSTSSSTPPPFIGTTLPQRNTANSSVPQRNNSNPSVDKAITMHPHAAGQLHSSTRPSATLHRHDVFLS